MSNQQQQLKNQESWSQGKVRNKTIVLGVLIGVIIALTPYYFTIYESVPDKEVWSTSWFTYKSQYYTSLYVLAYTLTNKLVPLLLLFIWFFTCRHWWYHSLLVPIAMYVYQIIIIMNDDLKFADSNQFLYLLPMMAIVIPSLYLIRAKMFNKLNDADKTFEELEQEFMIKPITFWDKVRQYF